MNRTRGTAMFEDPTYPARRKLAEDLDRHLAELSETVAIVRVKVLSEPRLRPQAIGPILRSLKQTRNWVGKHLEAISAALAGPDLDLEPGGDRAADVK